MNIIIAGTRDFGNLEKEQIQVFILLDKIFSKLNLQEQPVIVCGEALGIDACGKQYALQKGWKVDSYPADWNGLGRAAGPIRNQQMADVADMLIVIRKNNSRGSSDMLQRAKKKSIKIIDIVI